MDNLTPLRNGRAAGRHLRRLCENHALTEADARRLLDRIDEAFALLLDEPAPRPDLVLIPGRRP